MTIVENAGREPTRRCTSAFLPGSGETKGNYFDGMWQRNANYIGVWSDMTVRYAAVCDTDHSQYNPATGAMGNFTSAWTMLANASGNPGGWLQSGYLRAYGQP